jgi:hypothetical protein
MYGLVRQAQGSSVDDPLSNMVGSIPESTVRPCKTITSGMIPARTLLRISRYGIMAVMHSTQMDGSTLLPAVAEARTVDSEIHSSMAAVAASLRW